MTCPRLPLALAALLASGAASAKPPELDLYVHPAPATSRISVVAKLRGLACTGATTRLWLNRGLTVERASVDGRTVSPVLDPPGAGRIFISAARAIDLPCPRKTLELRYSGPGLLHPDGRNQVSPDYIELSYYGAWYPLTADEKRRAWRLHTRLPSGWTYVSNGRVAGTPARLVIESSDPAEVVLVGSPRFIAGPDRDGTRVLISDSASAAAQATAFALGREATAMANWLTKLLGPSGAQSNPELVFAPRTGPLSYARLPVIVTPQASLDAPGDRSLALNIRHEVAHFWSRAVGADNDWLNEGIAEYLALVRTRDSEGEAVQSALLERYRREVAAAGQGVPIAETAADERRGFVNRYQRVPLLLDAAERIAGRSAMEKLLRRAFALGPDLSTGSFETLAVQELGGGAAALIARCLRSRNWPIECGGHSGPS
ncbi:MAG: hypothetical protein B7Y43_15215 [Sphingomonas sp. 28-62-20]|uniref:hypothetical protein n=1 Tax=Sphingomonas sp. 28-62-20 TaxID=1970433 RepID=UPI000BD5DE2B|nr:MAG: hypothetical protein B7Y43_15215 [Sphingomonas sp. 28-62-20]